MDVVELAPRLYFIRLRIGHANVSRVQAAESFRRLAALDTTIACFGHGDPLTRNASAALKAPPSVGLPAEIKEPARILFRSS
jgi:hypothetical protein